MNLIMQLLHYFVLMYYIKSCLSDVIASPGVCDDSCSVEIGIVKHVLDKLNSQHAEISAMKSELAKISQRLPTNCMEAGGDGAVKSDLYRIQDHRVSAIPLTVWCDMETDNGGWLVIQRRINADVDFNRTWNEYKAGFGDLSGNYWIGLEKLHGLTSSCEQELYVKLETYDGKKYYAKYGLFEIGSEKYAYYLKKVGNYTGNAGDNFYCQKSFDFSTYDRDKDPFFNYNGAFETGGGWWHAVCEWSGLNGVYTKSGSKNLAWYVGERQIPLKYVQMMIRPTGEFINRLSMKNV